MSTTATKRSPAEWETLALELQPQLAEGVKLSQLRDRIGSTNVYALTVALARQGYDHKGQPLKLPRIAKAPAKMVERVINEREAGTPWYVLEAATGVTDVKLRKMIADASAQTNGDGDAHDDDADAPVDPE